MPGPDKAAIRAWCEAEKGCAGWGCWRWMLRPASCKEFCCGCGGSGGGGSAEEPADAPEPGAITQQPGGVKGAEEKPAAETELTEL